MVAAHNVVCIGRIDHKRLVVVLASPDSYDPDRGYDFRYAHVYVGCEGDTLQPMSAEATSMIDKAANGPSYVWSLQTSTGIFVSTLTSGSEKRTRFTWSSAFSGDILIRPLALHHFDLRGETGDAIRITSRPRQVIYAGTNGTRVLAVTAVGDIASAELYIGDTTSAQWAMTRLHAVDVTAGTEAFTFYADLQSVGVFSYTTVDAYKRGQRELLGRREAKQLFGTLDLPRKGYVGLFDGVLQPIDVQRVHFSQSEGIAWIS